MAIKKYAFLSLALLTSMSQAFFGSEDSCFKFYVGGDLGMGIFSIRHASIETEKVAEITAFSGLCVTNSNTVFIGGGRVGLAWTGSECWYAALEGNVHSASRCFGYSAAFHIDDDHEDAVLSLNDKTSFIAGVNAHLGYKAVEDGAVYGIVGYKYLKSRQDVFIGDYAVIPGGRVYEDVAASACYNNNGWVVGIGALMNLECNWDIRLEALYAKFGNKCATAQYVFKESGNDDVNLNISTTYSPRLFYGVVSLAYNF
jgi:opacity protein-like surface antigen